MDDPLLQEFFKQEILMYEKTPLFSGLDTDKKILESTSSFEQKRLGRHVKNLDQCKWDISTANKKFGGIEYTMSLVCGSVDDGSISSSLYFEYSDTGPVFISIL